MSPQVRCSSCHAPAPEAARFCPGCGSPLALRAPALDSRRIVTVLFMDLVSSTVLAETMDPEALRSTMDRYYDTCTEAITGRGGVVEKFIGDAVMAVFGAIVGHEDDALHAVQAACAVLEALDGVNARLERDFGVRLDVHCGIATGEAVVAGSTGGGARVVGDVVHTSARLQSQAGTNEIVVGAETVRLVRGRVPMEALPPLRLKGKREPVRAWRVREPQDRAEERQLTVPLVGREDELALLEQTFTAAAAVDRCRSVTLAGPAGIGKTRLLREFTARRAAAGALVLRGACQPHGAGLTYRPVIEAVHSLPGGWEQAESALRALHPNAERAVAALAVALGRDTGPRPRASVPEIAWAFRGLVDVLSRTRDVVLAFEDLHWAEPTLLELLQSLTEQHGAGRALIVGTVRTDDAADPGQPVLTGGTTVALAPLAGEDTDRLVRLLVAGPGPAERQLTDHQIARVVGESGGNPLFAELLTDSYLDGGPGGTSVPTSVRLLLTAWLDRLAPTDRDVLERAACVGGTFTTGDILALAADAPALTEQAVADSIRRLRRTGAIHPSGPVDGHRFTRMLARETLYEMTPKARRASWHTVLAGHLAATPDTAPLRSDGSGPGIDQAHHLESAVHLTTEVHPGHPDLPALSARAARALVANGYLALHLRDLGAAISLMERGRALTPDGDPEHRTLAVRIADAYGALGAWPRALEAAAEAERRCPGDPRTRDTCRVLRQTVALRVGGSPEPLPPAPDEDDDLSWCRLHQYQALRSFAASRLGEAETAARRALARADRLGDDYEQNRLLVTLCELAQWSPTPVGPTLELCDELAARFDGDRPLLIPVLLTRARMLGLSGRLAEARAAAAQAREHAQELSLAPGQAAGGQVAALLAALAGDHREAADGYLRSARLLAGLGQQATASTLTVYSARERLRSGDPQQCRTLLAGLDADALEPRASAVHHTLDAELALRAGRSAAAAAAAARALGAIDRTDDPYLRGDVGFDAARTLEAAGSPAAAHRAASDALGALLAKGATLPAAEVRSWLDSRRDRG